jgi:superfamily II DNA or RNA helicase
MPITNTDVTALVSKLHLGRDQQQKAVTAALRSLLVEERRGVVLADEVGFGKTYEALAIMALLSERARETHRAFDRVLVLCKSALLNKWQEEISSVRKGKGFPQYLTPDHWHARHPVRQLLQNVHVIRRRACAEEHRGVRDDGRLQARPGLYIVNQDVLTEKTRTTRLFLQRLYNTVWDLIIVDEAHHYARWVQPAYIFSPDGDMRNYDQGISGGRFAKILALTATPFELAPNEIIRLLALVRAEPVDVEHLAKGLEQYVRRLDQLFGIRQRSQTDPLRQELVQRLKRLRDENALEAELQIGGLQQLLRCYMVRNTKVQNERRYFIVNKTDGRYTPDPFDKFADLQKMLHTSPLLPFEGPDSLFYLQLRELIDETIGQARDGTGSRTFISTDLRQGLSSYPQIEKSKLLNKHNLESARRLKRLVSAWSREGSRRLHPKVQALADIVETIASEELAKIRQDPNRWVSKILVFNKLTGGTAPHLRTELQRRIAPLFDEHLKQSLLEHGWGSKEVFASRLREHIRQSLGDVKRECREDYPEFCRVPSEFQNKHFVKYRGRDLVDAYHDTLLGRTQQPLFLLRAATKAGVGDVALAAWVCSEITQPFKEALTHIIDYYLDDTPGEERPREDLVEMAERECIMRREEYTSVELIGRYDGDNVEQREAHRRNFNDLYNPFVLLVSQVGEEGIDLQEQCRYVIHYDLEWNPAKMEQREGRVDREGWGRRDEGFIDVRFMLLKGTYEERIFHTVMQRDQWFQVLVGSKKRELGQLDDDTAEPSLGDLGDGAIDVPEETGRLTPEEKRDVMMDLRPD